MICSISAGKCGSNWLDRLRSNKGFPTSDDLDLDHFLKNNDSNPKPSPEPSSSHSPHPDNKRVDNRKAGSEISSENGSDKQEWLGIMSNVLSDLFNMGEANQRYRFSGKKSSRKQINPKFCLVSTTSSNMEEQSSGCIRNDENAQTENETKEEENVNKADCGDNEEGERGEELFGYSRNEVTVIDTSCTEWKFEKLVFRKRNVWKVREKKGKSRVLGRKKRKRNGFDGNVDAKKKLKLSNEEDCLLPPKHGESPQDKQGEEVIKETSDYHSQVPKKRCLLSRLPKKAKRGDKSAILIKGISASKKTGAKCPKSASANSGIEKHQVACDKGLSTSFPIGKGFRD